LSLVLRRGKPEGSWRTAPIVSSVGRDQQLRRRQRRTPVSVLPTGAATSPTVAVAPASSRPSREVQQEQVGERTHLEQAMFRLARDHADAAALAARASPPDRQGEQTHSLLAMLMSYFALEAFINMIGADRLGTRYRHYDRMSPEGKWVEVTRLVSKTGKTFPEGGEEMRALSTLRTWRNALTHFKGEYEDVQQSDRGGETRTESMLSAENAARAVEIARTLYRRFYDFDRRSPPREFMWLDDRPHIGRARTPPRVSAPQVSPAAAPGAVAETARGPAPESLPAGAGGGATVPRRRRRRRRRP